MLAGCGLRVYLRKTVAATWKYTKGLNLSGKRSGGKEVSAVALRTARPMAHSRPNTALISSIRQ